MNRQIEEILTILYRLSRNLSLSPAEMVIMRNGHLRFAVDYGKLNEAIHIHIPITKNGRYLVILLDAFFKNWSSL